MRAFRAFQGCRRRIQDARASMDAGLGWSACRVVPLLLVYAWSSSQLVGLMVAASVAEQ
jgi:hypothetical protein